MNSKMVSLASIIERVYRTTDFESIPWSDAAEDVIDCLRLIGAPQVYLDKTTNGQGENPIPIIVENFRGELPMDLAVPGPCRMIFLNGDGLITSFKTMVESQDLFYQSPTVREQYNDQFSDNSSTLVATSLELKMDLAQEEIDKGDLTDAEAILEDVIDDVRQSQSRIATTGRHNQDFEPKYKLNGDFMFTNFKHGFVEMSYKALPIDSYGMPMVPDNERFIKAVEWYLIARLDYKKWRHTRNQGDERVWKNSDQEALWYTMSARSASRVPSLDMMESIKRMLLRSIPKINEHKHGWKNANVQERRKF
jgi:hypothetical protein